MSNSGRRVRFYVVVVLLAAVVFVATATTNWHENVLIRRATGIVLTTLVLWITEVMPLGVTGLLIPVGATLAGVLKWPDALGAWGDPILFLFLGAFLLARGLEKHGAFDFLVRGRWAQRFRGGQGLGLAMIVLLVAGLISTMQSNTAVAAMLLPLVVALARTVRSPAVVLLALSYGATFGGMATPIGTPPNFIGYAAMKKLDATVSFLSWMRVGVPVWIGTTVLAWGVLGLRKMATDRSRHATAATLAAEKPALAASRVADGLAPAEPVLSYAPSLAAASVQQQAARLWAVAAFIATVLVWLGSGFITSVTDPSHPLQALVKDYLPESLPPILAAALLFIVHVGPKREPVLDRHDFQALDWDTLFLIAGGLCLGKMLQSSGAASALAATVSRTHLSPLVAMVGIGGVTVLLSELTSNTATAALMVPIAVSLAPAVGLSPVQTIWLVALCASLGFALPVSTPPNAIIYGTRLVPLKTMALSGIVVDVLSLIWVVSCVRWLA